MGERKRYAWGEIVSLGSLRVGSLRERLIQFYRLMGSQPGRVTIYTAEQIATVIGTEGTERETAARKIHKARSALVREGILERVEDPNHFSQDDTPIYSWRTVDPELDEAAFEILNRKAPAWREFIVKGEQVFWTLDSLIDNIPRVAMIRYQGKKRTWDEVFPELVDFTDLDIVHLWAEKVPRAIESKRHPLAHKRSHRGQMVGIKHDWLRLQIALAGVDSLIGHRLARNPGWAQSVESPIGWFLSTLGKVGNPKHPECEPGISAKEMAQWLVDNKDVPKLADLADKALEAMLPARLRNEQATGKAVPLEGPDEATEGGGPNETERAFQDIANAL